jgi:hypothetical protein
MLRVHGRRDGNPIDRLLATGGVVHFTFHFSHRAARISGGGYSTWIFIVYVIFGHPCPMRPTLDPKFNLGTGNPGNFSLPLTSRLAEAHSMAQCPTANHMHVVYETK